MEAIDEGDDENSGTNMETSKSAIHSGASNVYQDTLERTWESKDMGELKQISKLDKRRTQRKQRTPRRNNWN